MKNILLVLFWLVVSLCAGFSGQGMPGAAAGEKPKVVIKLATMAPQGHVLTKHAEEFIAQVNKETHNEVKVKIYWGGVQGDDNQALRKIRFGQLHGGFFIGNGLGQIVPEVRVTELPYLFNLDEEVAYVRSQLDERMRKLFAEKGFIVLGWTNVGFVYNFSKIPIRSIETLRQQKCWVDNNDPLAEAIYHAMGITPVPLSLSDVLTAVTANLIDTAPCTPFGALAFRFQSKFKYMSDFPVSNVIGADIVTKKVWDRITPESRRKIMDLVKDYSAERNRELIETNAKSIELLKKAGIEIVHVDPAEKPEEVAFLQEAGQKVREGQVGKLYSRELLDTTMALLEKYRREHNIESRISFIK